MKKLLMIAILAVASLFLTANVNATTLTLLKQEDATQTNLSNASNSYMINSEITISSDSVQNINAMIMITKGGKLTISGMNKITIGKQIQVIQEGAQLIINAKDVDATQAGLAVVLNGATLTINEGVKIDATGKNLINVSNGVNIILDGDITAKCLVNVSGADESAEGGPAEIVVKGGTYDVTEQAFTSVSEDRKQNVTIEDGDFSSIEHLFGTTNGTVNIKGGKFNAEDESILDEYITEGFELNEDGTVSKIEEPTNSQSTTQTPAEKEVPSDEEKNPNTSDKIAMYILLGGLSGLAIVYTLKKRYN